MSIFSGKTVYGENWTVVGTRKFTANELKEVKAAYVVDSQYGASACFTLINGGNVYIPMANDSSSTIGDSLQLSDCEIVTLTRQGTTIERIRG